MNQPRQILGSSETSEPTQAKWYRRNGVLEDPWISIRNHGEADHDILYGAANHSLYTELLSHGGADVYIRTDPCNDGITLFYPHVQ